MKKETKKGVLHPDDKFFRVLMQETENAKAYLVNFYAPIAALVDLDTLHLTNTSFTNTQLKTFESDIVYRCRFKGVSEELYFALLWEHKSEPEENIAIQVGLYIMQALYLLRKGKHKKLEPILPLIFYNGKEDWEPKTITQLFQDHPFLESFEDYLPNFQLLFKNIANTPHEDLLAIKERFFRSAMIAMSNRFKADLLMEHISIIFEEDDSERLMSIANYFFAIIERSPKKIQNAIENLEFTTKSKIMSTLNLLREEGKMEGIALGIEKGIVQGIEKGIVQGIEKGIVQGIGKGEYKKSVIAIRNMTIKEFELAIIAEVLNVEKEYVQKIQKELKFESKIIALLAKKQTPVQIAKKLKISEWLVEVIEDLLKK